MLINNNTVGDNHDENAQIMNFIESIMDSFIFHFELIDRNDSIILINNKIFDIFLLDNFLQLTEVIQHSCWSEKLIMKQQVVSYFQHKKIYNYYKFCKSLLLYFNHQLKYFVFIFLLVEKMKKYFFLLFHDN